MISAAMAARAPSHLPSMSAMGGKRTGDGRRSGPFYQPTVLSTSGESLYPFDNERR
jgi:hypothetical protein